MEFELNISNEERRLKVERSPDGFVVTVEGREYVVADPVAQDGRLSFTIGHRVYSALISNGAGGAGFSMHGRHYRIVETERDADRPAATHATHGRLEAPMPGSIVSVNVAVGDEVTAGTPIIVLESMKMQNEITAPFDGTVDRISCTPGEQVGFGQELAEIVPREAP